jgi:hypothetical protein
LIADDEGDGTEAAATIDGNALELEGFYSAGLDGSASSYALHQKTCQLNNKSRYKEARIRIP